MKYIVNIKEAAYKVGNRPPYPKSKIELEYVDKNLQQHIKGMEEELDYLKGKITDAKEEAKEEAREKQQLVENLQHFRINF